MNRNLPSDNVSTIAIFGHYGHENLGDEAIIQACLEQYRERFPDTRLVLFSSMPADSEQRYGLPARPIRRRSRDNMSSSEHLVLDQTQAIDHRGYSQSDDDKEDSWLRRSAKRIPMLTATVHFARASTQRVVHGAKELGFLLSAWRSLRDIDLLAVTGSNQFLDNFGGPWGFPYTLLKWRILARLAGIPVVFISVGAGPLSHASSRAMIRMAIRGAAYLSFRDEASRVLVDPRKQFSGQVYPDLAFAIARPEGCAPRSLPSDAPIVAVNPMAVYDARYWYDPDPQRYNDYVAKLANFIAALAERGCRPKLFATQCKDVNVIDDVILRLRESDNAVAELAASLHEPTKTVDELLRLLCAADIVVPTRFHGTVLSLWAGKPTIGICYYRKTADLLAEFGQARFAFDIDDFSVEQLDAAVASALDDYQAIAQHIAGKSARRAAALDQQFGHLHDLLYRSAGEQLASDLTD